MCDSLLQYYKFSTVREFQFLECLNYLNLRYAKFKHETFFVTWRFIIHF